MENENTAKTRIVRPHKEKNTLLTFLIVAIVILIGLLIYFNTGDRVNKTAEANAQANATQAAITEITNLTPKDVLVSFRLDDITFAKSQKPALENALALAHKYNITFDLAVIAQSFDKYKDNETFRIYQNNQDVFEVIAHGLTHSNPINPNHKGEFYDTTDKKPIHPEIQENHIRKMKDIFEKYNLITATKILVPPWHAGDNNTIDLAENYGYNLIVQGYISNKSYEYKKGEITITKSLIEIPMNQTLSNKDIQEAVKDIIALISKNQTKIQIITHSVNYLNDTLLSIDKAISEIVNNSSDKSRIKFSFISDRFANEK
jgi:peptidoglycan/xylan/chitin deacetylase (PgdA/CDA1 family)